jgi:NADH:ubiquinone oxidoreductase subunit E
MMTVEICLGTACHLMGTQDLMDVLDALPPDMRQRIEIKGITCLNSCGKGPNIRINGSLLTDVTPDALLEALQDSLNMEVI